MPILMPAASGKTRELAPIGSHLATCYSIVQLGTQKNEFDGTARQKIRFVWELLDEYMADERPFVIGKTYNLSSHPSSAMRLDIESWLGRGLDGGELGGFDLEQLIGLVAVVGVKHLQGRNGDYAGLASVTKPPKGVPERRTPRNEPVVFSFSPYHPEVFAALPGWMKDAIAATPEFRAATDGVALPPPAPPPRRQSPPLRLQPQPVREIDDEDIPF